jgi:hypothetical protein
LVGTKFLIFEQSRCWSAAPPTRKPLFLAGFAILPIRAVIYTFSNDSFWLIGVQVLDGVGAGIFLSCAANRRRISCRTSL